MRDEGIHVRQFFDPFDGRFSRPVSRPNVDANDQRASRSVHQISQLVLHLCGELEGMRGNHPIVVIGGGEQDGRIRCRLSGNVVQRRDALHPTELFGQIGIAVLAAPIVT